MINQNKAADIRTCERVKFDQALYILNMYEKKFRVPLNFDPKDPIDAEKEYENSIIKSWNKKWEMDLTKPILNCVTSVYPFVLYDSLNLKLSNSDAQQYNSIIQHFIKRLKIEYEDETNFKITEHFIDEIIMPDHKKGRGHVMQSVFDFIKAIKSMTSNMITSIQIKEEKLQNLGNDYNYCCSIAQILQGILQITDDFEGNLQANQQLQYFVYSMMKVLDDVKQSEQGATLAAVQPNVKDFTFLLHPLMLPIYANLKRQKQQAKRKHDQKQQARNPDKNKSMETQNLSGKPFKQFFNASTNSLSRTVFLNLDGYQSQYNLEFARCFRKNLMYISFPKWDVYSKNQDNSVYERKFYKKLMYNNEKNILKAYENSFSSQSPSQQMMMQQQALNDLNEAYLLANDSQDYFKNVQGQLYELQKGLKDLNKNLYIFPLRLHSLQQNFNELKEDSEDLLETYQSVVILQIFRYFLINQIRQFNPTQIIVSYSGRLRIEDKHFVQIIQELTKLSHYKVILFPNMTASFTNSIIPNYDINTKDINYMNATLQDFGMNDDMEQERDDGQISYSLFNKIARFLKISSGNHNLMRQNMEEGSLTKYKNLIVLKKINNLLQVLGREYENIEKIRFKNKEINFIPKLYEKDYLKVAKVFNKLVPRFYSDLYDVIEAMIAVHESYNLDNELVIKLLNDFGIVPDAVKRNVEIKELIEYIKDKIVIRDIVSEELRATAFYDNIIKKLSSEKEKHFMEIAEEKYQESVLLYFRFITSKQLYEQSKKIKPNYRGLIDVSFANPNKQSREPLYIYDTTRILYTIDQRNTTGLIPIIITNHLPLEKKFVPKFSNYCVFLDRALVEKQSSLNPKSQKIPQIRKQKKIHPIKFFDIEGNEIEEHRFEFRVEWNFMETSNYMFLYWPSMFNMIEAVCCKIQGKGYEAPLLNEFFISDKKVVNNEVHFYQAAVPNDISPRNGCTAFSLNNNIYLFGGFYERSKNYLNLQKDITRLNLEHYNHENQRKIQIVNEKDNLYPVIEPFSEKGQYPRRNSYVRVKQEYQFYEIQDICQHFQVQPGVKKIVMIGGFGQNFLHPYSMLTYFYYILRFQQNTSMLLSVQKKMIYNNTVPINTKSPTKNLGIIKTNIRSKNQVNQKKISSQAQLTEENSYCRFRVVYLLNERENVFEYRFQYAFSEKDLKYHKEELRKINEEKAEIKNYSSVRIEKIDGINNKLIVERYGSKQVIHLRLELPESEKKQEFFRLTNEAVVYLNIVNANYICAIVKHPLFTKGKSMIVQCKNKAIEKQSQDETFFSLKPITTQQLDGDLSLHIIEASNINLVYVLHGYRIFESEKIHEYHIMTNRRDNKKNISEIKPNQPVFGHQTRIRCCYSVFLYRKSTMKNQIICENYISIEGDPNIYLLIQKFQPMESANLRWCSVGKPIPLSFCFRSLSNLIRLERMTFLEFFKEQGKRRIIIVQYNRKKYRTVINQDEYENGENHIMMEQVNEQEIRRLDELEADKGTILHKSPDNYFDRGYVEIQ